MMSLSQAACRMLGKPIGIAAAIVLIPSSSSAHVGPHDELGFWEALQHLFGSVDHALTILAVGVLVGVLVGAMKAHARS